MANVINKTPNPESLQYTYLDSVNTPDYDPLYWVYNPDVHELKNTEVPQKYWKPESYYDSTAGTVWRVVEMDQSEKDAVEAAIPVQEPQSVVIDSYKEGITQDVHLHDEFRDSGGRLRVHQTSRKSGLAIHWTSVGDDRDQPTMFGSGNHLSYEHKIGDTTSEIVYVDFNGLLNESWIHEVVLTWSQCHLDLVTVDIVPDACTVMDSTAGNFTRYEAILLPAVPGTGDCDLASDVLAYHGGLVAKDNPSDPDEPITPAFWNADFNQETGRFENLTAAPAGDGTYNIFHEERVLNRTFNEIQLLQGGFQVFNSSDTDQLTHGLRLRVEFKTHLPDHDWTVSGILVMHRKLVSIKSDGCF